VNSDLPPDVRQFIADYIASVADLEVLLLLRGAADREWSAAEVGKMLYTMPEMSSAQLVRLHAQKLLEAAESSEPRYRYAPGTPELARTIDQVAKLYSERRVSMITAIYNRPIDKVQTFADAFRLRKDP
jgi:hypothetical protein